MVAQPMGIPAFKIMICPSAPEIPERNRTPVPFPYDPYFYPGTVNSAWVITNSAGVDSYGWGWKGEMFAQDTPNVRVGSYGNNPWVAGNGHWPLGVKGRLEQQFTVETGVERPTQTPVFADGVPWWFGTRLGGGYGPTAGDWPARNLEIGAVPEAPYNYMAGFTIPRHGSRPSKAPSSHPPQQRLPGAINMSFYDGHVELVKLERLWQLYWHRGYVPPARRPGL